MNRQEQQEQQEQQDQRQSDVDGGQEEKREVFLRDGYLHQRQLLLQEDIAIWQVLFSELWPFIFAKLAEHGHISSGGSPTTTSEESTLSLENQDGGPTNREDKKKSYALGLGVKHGFREVVMRSPGRYEFSLLNHDGWFRERKNGFTFLERLKEKLGDTVLPLLNQSSWEDVNIANLSFVVSTPGATTQGWHVDGSHISLEQHGPCHCFNVFIPLCDMPSMEWGPTEIRPGSHYYTRNLAPMLLAAKCRKQLRLTVAPLLQRGDVLIFDYRILHRGLANLTQEHNRAVLVLTVSEKWFEDRVNFPKRSIYENAVEEEEKEDRDCR